MGGSGLGILSPYPEHRNQRHGETLGQVTPPETPDASLGPGNTLYTLRPTFESKPVLELSKWAESLGRWLYV